MGIRYLLPREPDAEISGIQYALGLCVLPKADRRNPKENAPQIQTCVIKGAALADRKFAIVCQKIIYSIKIKAQRKKRRAAAESKRHSDRMESAAHMVFRAIVRVIYGTGVGVLMRRL